MLKRIILLYTLAGSFNILFKLCLKLKAPWQEVQALSQKQSHSCGSQPVSQSPITASHRQTEASRMWKWVWD